MTALFKLAPGKAQSVRTAEGSVIVRLKQVEPVDLAKDKEALDRFGKQVDAMVANDLILQLVCGAAHQVRRDGRRGGRSRRPSGRSSSRKRRHVDLARLRRLRRVLRRRQAAARLDQRWSPTSRRRSRPISSWPTGGPTPSCSRIGRGRLGARPLLDHRLQAGRDLALRQGPGRDQPPRPRPTRRPSSRSTAGRWRRCAC